MPVNVYVGLRTEGVSALVDLTGGRLPSVPYWGSDLGDLTAADAAAIVRAASSPAPRTSPTSRCAWPCCLSNGPAGLVVPD